jgi:hypothetical protein
VLELGMEDFMLFKEFMFETQNKKDTSLLESILKRNAVLKKGF